MSFIVFSFQHFVFCQNIVKGNTTEELRDVLLLLLNPVDIKMWNTKELIFKFLEYNNHTRGCDLSSYETNH